MEQKKDSTITVRLPEIDKLRLEKLAHKRKTTPSSIVQMLIKQKTNQKD
jgi:predicted transcriptional regulator